MSNGVAYVLDEAGTFGSRINRDMVELTDLDERDVELLQRLVREHEERTASPRARTILVQWESFLPLFRKVAPKGAEAYVSATREAYLASERAEIEPALARRSA
jgi:glutamate synthase domain-containing protein 3